MTGDDFSVGESCWTRGGMMCGGVGEDRVYTGEEGEPQRYRFSRLRVWGVKVPEYQASEEV